MNLPVISYVREYFEIYFNTYCNRLSKQVIDTMVYKIARQIEEIEGYTVTQVRDGLADESIRTVILTDVHKSYPELFDYHIELKTKVTKVINSHYHVNCSIKTYDLIVERVISILIKIYGYDGVLGDGLDNKICFCYQKVDKSLRNAMIQYLIPYIREYITRAEMPLLYVDVETVAKNIVRDIMTTNNINAASLLTGRYGKMIEEYTKKNNRENESKRKQQEQVINPVNNNVGAVFQQINFINMSSNVSVVNKQLALDNVEKMRNSSVKVKGKPDKIKKNSTKRKITKTISSLLLLATLLNVGSYVVNTIVDNVNEANAINRYENFNDFNYSRFFLNDEERYESMANYVIDYYLDVQELDNQHYYSMGFYNLLSSGHLTDEELDIVLRLVQEKISQRDDCAELEAIFFNNLSYLDFIYNRLIAMGCEEITDQRYQNAILAYKQSNFANRYGIPADNLYQYEKDLIKEIKELYEKYNRDYMIELGKMVQFDGNTYYLIYDSGTKGRQV